MFNIAFIMVLIMCGCAYARVGSCGVDQKVIYSDTVIDSPIVEYQWLTTNSTSNIIFALSEKDILLRSDTGGVNWDPQTSSLIDVQTLDTGSNSTGVRSIVTTSDPLHIYFVGFGRRLWTTSDGGLSYKYNNATPFFTERFFAHPVDKNIAAAVTDSFGCLAGRSDCWLELWITADFGVTWTQIDTYVNLFTWGNAGSEGFAHSSFWYTYLTDKNGDWKTKSVMVQEMAFFDGYTTKVMFRRCGGLLYFKRTMFVAQVSEAWNTYELYVSFDFGHNFRFVNFPTDSNEFLYTILSVSEAGECFINVVHSSFDWGNTYSSDEMGNNFVLSLPYTYLDSAGIVSFTKVAALEGVYFANVVTDKNVRSVVSYDNGAFWNPLSLPYDASGKMKMKCNDPGNCSLHVHNVHKAPNTVKRLTSFGPFYSRASSIGMLMATGNVGATLSDDLKQVNTFLSNDAGATWYLIADESSIYEFADHGALLLMTGTSNNTSVIEYSWNEGLNVSSCATTGLQPFLVHDIIADPRQADQRFLVLTQLDNGMGMILAVDFSNFHERPCVYPQDYYTWVFMNPNSTRPDCVLGQSTGYVRRQRDRECYNGILFETHTQPSFCSCELDDYECDFCYERIGSHCSPSQESTCLNWTAPTQCNPDGFQYITRGYRKVPGDLCDVTLPGSLNLGPTKIPCNVVPPPPPNPPGLRGGTIFLIIVLGLVFIGLVVFAITPRGRQMFRHLWGRRPARFSDIHGGTSFDTSLIEYSAAPTGDI